MRAFVVVVFSFAFPGFGAAFARQNRAMLAWLAATVVAALASLVSIWLLPLVFAVRFAGAADGFRRVRAAVRLGVRLDGTAALITIALHVAAGLGLRATTLSAFKQVSSSMAPTLTVGDHVLTDKLSLLWRPVERGDLIVFRQPCQPVDGPPVASGSPGRTTRTFSQWIQSAVAAASQGREVPPETPVGHVALPRQCHVTRLRRPRSTFATGIG